MNWKASVQQKQLWSEYMNAHGGGGGMFLPLVQ